MRKTNIASVTPAEQKSAAMSLPSAEQEFEALLPFGIVGDADALFTTMNAAARIPYEGRPCTGSILIRPCREARSGATFAFADPIQAPDITGLRKLLELSSHTFPLVFDGQHFHGFLPYDGTGSHPLIKFYGPDRWDVELNGTTRLSVEGGAIAAQRPGNTLTKAVFHSHLARVFDDIGSERIEIMWSIAEVAVAQSYGTNILFTHHAESESRRLAAQCIPVAPFQLTPRLVRTFALVDGTTIADLDGRVHAVSAILDGTTSGNGSWERGGRYNSAVNYLCHHPNPALILSVSQDGGIEILPPIGYQSGSWKQNRYRRLSSTAI